MSDAAAQWFVGIDWGSEQHHVCVVDTRGTRVSTRAVAHSGAGLGELVAALHALAPEASATVWVAIEVPRGPVVETLLEAGFTVFMVNPRQVDRLRDQFSMAGAKDDRRDAWVMASSLRTQPQVFRRLVVDAPAVIELREYSRLAQELTEERTRLLHRLRAQLGRYYPQLLAVAPALDRTWVWSLWELAPTPAAAATVRPAAVQALLKRHGVRCVDAAAVLQALRAPSVTVAPGTERAAVMHLRSLLPRLRLVHEQLRTCTRELEHRALAYTTPEDPMGDTGEQRDVTILRSLPGIGRIVLGTLLAEAPEALRRRDYHRLRLECGVGPVTKQSGKSRVVLRRYARNHRLSNAAHYMANGAIQRDPHWRAYYTVLRARGHSHGRALRTIGDRQLATLCAMLATRTLYDPARARRKAA